MVLTERAEPASGRANLTVIAQDTLASPLPSVGQVPLQEGALKHPPAKAPRRSNHFSVSRRVKDAEQEIDTAKLGLNYESSNESYLCVVSMLESLAGNLPHVRFAGVAGGGDAFLNLFGALATHKHFQSSVALDINAVQLHHLSWIADQIASAVSEGGRSIITEFIAGGALRPDISIFDECELFFHSRFDLCKKDGTPIQDNLPYRIMEKPCGFALRLSDLAGGCFGLRDFDGSVIGAIEVGEYPYMADFLHGEHRTRIKSGVRYGVRPVKSFYRPVPVTNTLNESIDKYLRNVKPKAAPNVIYLSNIYNPFFHNGWGGHLLYYIAGEKKFEEGTIIIESHNPALNANVLMKREGKLFRVDGPLDNKAVAMQDAFKLNPYNISNFPSNPYAHMRR
ncbi:MAG: hypothetical protein LVQ95_02730 [Candidatus Micrarchaeales archaeon]|nr:hypothetical protein [Candidatus Micrarchaeales archaeon]